MIKPYERSSYSSSKSVLAIPRCCSMRFTRRNKSASNSLSVETSLLGGNGSKIASKVLGRDPRCSVSDLGQIACCSGRSTNDFGKRPVIDFRSLVV
jgi:hypothetical protein